MMTIIWLPVRKETGPELRVQKWNTKGGENIGLLSDLFWVSAVIATGGLAAAVLPNDWNGIDGYDGGCDE